MNYDEAKQLLLLHGSGIHRPAVPEPYFWEMLRLYDGGLHERNFHVVMQALFVVGERVHSSAQVDRDLIESLWTMCCWSRRIGVESDGGLQRNKLIAAHDVARLKTWIDTIEDTALGFLRGCRPQDRIEGYCQYVVDVGPGENIEFFVPLMQKYLDDPDCSCPCIVFEALGKLGALVKEILPSLRAAALRTYDPFYVSADDRAMFTKVIRVIEAAV
jgi:hypothetical protein